MGTINETKINVSEKDINLIEISRENWKKFGLASVCLLLMLAVAMLILTINNTNVYVLSTTQCSPTKEEVSSTTVASNSSELIQPNKYPPTLKPLPENAGTMNAISLLNEMGIRPLYTEIRCISVQHKPVFKYNVTVYDFTFTSEGGDTKKEAKVGAAMVACEEIFQMKFADKVPTPSYPCISSASFSSDLF